MNGLFPWGGEISDLLGRPPVQGLTQEVSTDCSGGEVMTLQVARQTGGAGMLGCDTVKGWKWGNN